MSEQNLAYYICCILAFVPAIVLHEVAHGFVAYKLGDKTAKSMGRLSLNPLKHVDPFGTVLLPLMLMILNMPIFGYAKPVPYNPGAFKSIRRDDFLVGIAGPCANFVMALLGSLVFHLLEPIQGLLVGNTITLYFYVMFLPQFIMINLVLMFFNLIPIPPLDGSSIIALFIPKKHLYKWYSIQQYSMIVLMIILFICPYIFNVSPFSAYLQFTAGNLTHLLIYG